MISPKLKKAAENNAKLVAMRPLPKETLKSLRAFYRVGLTYSSNAIEGNSLTETETKVVIEDGLTVGGKPLAMSMRRWGMPRRTTGFIPSPSTRFWKSPTS